MAHAIEYTDTNLVRFTMSRDDADLLQDLLGKMWSGEHDHLWEALAQREKVSTRENSAL